MTAPLRSPALLLLAVGLLLGLNFPLAKLARQAAVPALLWAALISLGVSMVLGVWTLARRHPLACDVRHGRYFLVTAVVSYAVPNLLVLSVVEPLGSGLTALLFALSPPFTALLSRLARLRSPQRLEWAGIGIAFAGAALVALARGEVGRPAAWTWVALGLAIPLLLAMGNVYRTLDWPPHADPVWLSVGSHGVAAVLLLAACVATGAFAGLPALFTVPRLGMLQVVAAALMFPLFFLLQATGGPVLLSQIGTVAAAAGVAVGALLLGERYPAQVWMGVVLIALGTGLTVRARWHH